MPTKRLAPTNVEGGFRIDPGIDSDVLASASEVAFLAASTMGLDEDDATVTWISSQDFYIGYERILQVTATQAELDAFYDTIHVVPSQALCVVNFESDTAFAIISPDTRLGNHNQFIKGSYGRTFDANLLKFTPLTEGITVTSTIIDDIMESYTGPYPFIVKDDLTHLTKCDDFIIVQPPHITVDCAVSFDTISFYETGALADVFDDCDSIESSIARAFGKIIIHNPSFPTFPVYNGGTRSLPMDELIESEDDIEDPEEFLREEYCQILPYIESYVRGGSYIMTYEQAADFLDEHGIIITTYQGDNNTVAFQAMQDGKIPLLYKDNEWNIVFQCNTMTFYCPYGNTHHRCLYSIDKCQFDPIADIDKEIDDSYTVVIIEYEH